MSKSKFLKFSVILKNHNLLVLQNYHFLKKIKSCPSDYPAFELKWKEKTEITQDANETFPVIAM